MASDEVLKLLIAVIAGVSGTLLFLLALGWIGLEMPRLRALLREQRHLNSREITLRAQLQDAYDEQEVLVQQQQVLLAEVDRLYREQAQAAVTDAITGLPNHRAVMSKFEDEVSHCQQNHGSCVVLFVDLDHFKRINDTWGHRAGDAVLCQIGKRLCSSLHQKDFVGRYGGEEFAVILPDTDINGADRVGERLRATIATQPCLWESEDGAIVTIWLTVSVGVAIYQLHGVTCEALIESADRAMYRAKQNGRNCVCIADVPLPSAGLTQEAIPLAARILSVVDSFDP